MKKPLVIAGVVILILVVLVAALPFLIDVNRFKPTLETDLSTALGRKVQMGNIQLALLSGAVKVDNISIAEDPAFGTAPFLQAKQLAAGVALQPLIFSKKLEISSFTITDPQVTPAAQCFGHVEFLKPGWRIETEKRRRIEPHGLLGPENIDCERHRDRGQDWPRRENADLPECRSGRVRPFLHDAVSFPSHGENSRERFRED